MTIENQSVAEIAAGLTKAQRAAIGLHGERGLVLAPHSLAMECVKLGIMKHDTPKPASELGAFERADVALGRADWVWADYIAEGYRQFDALLAASGKTFGPAWVAERKANARAWAEINCPPSKRGKSLITYTMETEL